MFVKLKAVFQAGLLDQIGAPIFHQQEYDVLVSFQAFGFERDHSYSFPFGTDLLPADCTKNLLRQTLRVYAAP
jgi:hypothetical protein